MAIFMKEITKNGHKVRKRVEHKWPSKLVLVEWVEFLSKEPDNVSRGLGLEDDFEVPIEVTKMENSDAGMKLMSGRLIGEEPSNQIVIVEHGGVDVPTVGRTVLPNPVILSISAYKPSLEQDVDDFMGWAHDNKGGFSIRSVYSTSYGLDVTINEKNMALDLAHFDHSKAAGCVEIGQKPLSMCCGFVPQLWQHGV
ncbi:hypothetical protein GOBAR_DD26371 [Gossypium barbadense]|nr:hypothetical protein GOBAR_DD26371 [Gossypium barbadense]